MTLYHSVLLHNNSIEVWGMWPSWISQYSLSSRFNWRQVSPVIIPWSVCANGQPLIRSGSQCHMYKIRMCATSQQASSLQAYKPTITSLQLTITNLQVNKAWYKLHSSSSMGPAQSPWIQGWKEGYSLVLGLACSAMGTTLLVNTGKV